MLLSIWELFASHPILLQKEKQRSSVTSNYIEASLKMCSERKCDRRENSWKITSYTVY